MRGMWHLKIKYRHSDCIYSPKLQEYNVNGFFYFLGNYEKNGYTYTSALITLNGDEKNVKRYFDYLKNHKKVVTCEIYDRAIFVLAKHKSDLEVYKVGYNPVYIYPAPSYLSEDGYEIMDMASWNRKDLEDAVKSLKKNKTTTYFEILSFTRLKMKDVFVSRLLPDIAPKQEEALRLALSEGYYSFPRKINLDKLAKFSKVSKATFRENLRKAEIKTLSILVQK